MKMLDHPNIVKLYEVITAEKTLYLVMEYASGGEVFDYLVAHGRMKEKEARVKFRQIVSSVQYCHQKHVVHRDLKAENLLLDADMNIKIADFGFSNEYSPGQRLDTFCGSPPYAAPELFQGKKYEGPEVDVWSLGVILYTLVSGSLPFDGQNLKELRERVLRGKYRIPFYMSTDCEALLKRMLVLNPAKRHSLDAVMKDKWMNIGFEDSPLVPFVEPPQVFDDPVITEIMVNMGFSRDQISDSLHSGKFDNVTATYLLLCRRNNQLDRRPPRAAPPAPRASATRRLPTRLVPEAAPVAAPLAPRASAAESAVMTAPEKRQVGRPRRARRRRRRPQRQRRLRLRQQRHLRRLHQRPARPAAPRAAEAAEPAAASTRRRSTTSTSSSSRLRRPRRQTDSAATCLAGAAVAAAAAVWLRPGPAARSSATTPDQRQRSGRP
ncbi:hypothetical protein BOX15_Mlig008511g1 [Macrostomum lignano]|uniref:non-specific serine/threonine protein kinase n=1 Tax=Macrostomum lignano TaxID=282301 RepID=A0A267F9S3_9PLAT|nr:hypothetical protein BOX15_Mlig008511g1 [Macrostomum lignano]